MNGRTSGILLPVSSLPGPYGIGNLGQPAYEFIDFLSEARQSYWQILPLGPTSIGDSPYQSFSTFAGNPYLIDLDYLVRLGLLLEPEVHLPSHDPEAIDYGLIYHTRIPLLRLAYSRIDEPLRQAVLSFSKDEPWLHDYALFMTLKEQHEGKPWFAWPEADKRREPDRLWHFAESFETDIAFWYFVQYLFFEQWQALKKYGEEKGVQIIGDIPLYVAQDSVDVWANPDLFQLDDDLLPKAVAGYPPDDFSTVGQLWGNPLFDWEGMKENNYAWWQARLAHQMRLYHVVRLDHFIGFSRFWAIPYGDKTAKRGQWIDGPGSHFFQTVQSRNPSLNLIAEDLGLITEEVVAMRLAASLPSMRVLMFGFDPNGDSENMPHHYTLDTIAYTGTHDNHTVLGWWQTLDDKTKDFARQYLHFEGDEVLDGMLRGLFASGAKICLTTMQDLLNQDSRSRINEPNTMGNWTYRLPSDYLAQVDRGYLKRLTETYRRTADELV